jgi:glycosyltransferase involved in cell wall biosynthesis
MESEKREKIQVLYILTKLELGGAQKVCLELLKGVCEQGFSSGLMTGTQGVLREQVQNRSGTIFLESFKREVGLKGIWQEPKTFLLMISHMRRLKKENPELIIHTHSTKAGIMGRWAAFFAGIKIRIHTVHGFGFHEYQSSISWYFAYVCESLTPLITTHFICVSEKDAKEGQARLPGFSKKYSLIRAAVDFNRFFIPAKRLPALAQQDDIIIGTVACFKPQKNIFDLCTAFYDVWQLQSSIIQKRLFLQIIGDGFLRSSLESWIVEHGMEQNIQLLGWQTDVAAWMKKWYLFALSSLWEGLPCAVIEARLSKLPVIAYEVGGIQEVIFDYKNGFLVKPHDIEGLKKRLDLCIQDRSLYEKMALYEDDLESFSVKNMVQEHVQLYELLLKKTGKNPITL